MMIEKTLVVVKPGSAHELFIINYYVKSGLHIIGIKPFWFSKESVGEFYWDKQGTAFYEEIVEYMTAGMCWAFVLEGKDAIARAREITGDTDPRKAECGTVRHAFGKDKTRNAVHASDSTDSYINEVDLIFNELPSSADPRCPCAGCSSEVT